MNADESSSNHPLSPEWVWQRLNSCLSLSPASTSFVVAFSGGMDSTALLHLMVQLRQQGHIHDLQAVHVHHGLSAFADEWLAHCQHLCQQWDVPLSVSRVNLTNKGKGIEQAAREGRYQVFSDTLGDHSVLLQGHHRDDQTETILQRLFRGTGVEGIQGIPEYRVLGDGAIFRPLLPTPRQQIEAYIQQNDLTHIEDDSNADEQYSRNYLRQTIIPLIEDRWPGAPGRIVAFANEAGAVHRQVADITAENLKQCLEYHPEWLLGEQPLLNWHRVQQLNANQQSSVVRSWLQHQGVRMTSRFQLQQIFNELMDARIDGEPQLNIGEGISIRRFRQVLGVLDERQLLSDFDPFVWHWQENNSIALGARSLMIKPSASANKRVNVRLPDSSLTICRRCHVSGHEKIAIAGRSGRKSLKRWLQEYHVPPWLREFVPLIYDNGQMVAAAGLWVCEGYQPEGSTPLALSWSSL